MSADSAPPPNVNNHIHRPNPFKRLTSKIFGKHKERNLITTNTTSATTNDNTANNIGQTENVIFTSSTSGGGRPLSAALSQRPLASSHHRHRYTRSETTSSLFPTRRTSIQGIRNLMSVALPPAGPDRVRAILAILAEIEKYDHLQRRSMLRNLPPLQFRVTIERRIDGRLQETEVEVSMDELRDQLKEILRAEGNGVPSTTTNESQIRDGNLRQVKSKENNAVKDSSIFPTHIHDGHPLPEEKTSCTICLEEFYKGDEIKTIPCMHFYHSECIDEWFKRSKSCPICNASAG